VATSQNSEKKHWSSHILTNHANMCDYWNVSKYNIENFQKHQNKQMYNLHLIWMNKMMQIALIHAPLFSRAKIKQPSNLQSCKRNVAHLSLARQYLMMIYEYRSIDIYHWWTIKSNWGLRGMILFWLCLWMPPKFKLLVLRCVPIFFIGHFGLWDTWPKTKTLCKNNPACVDLGLALL
jgi:hypothetical protein